MMKISRVYREQASQAQGVVIVIDVIRAFSVAAYAFDGGARGLWLVRTVEDALALRNKEPGTLLAGEVGGRLIPGFDLNNSPVDTARMDVQDKLIIQRTGAGTQGAVGASNATHLLLCGLTNAQATATYARTLSASTGGVITLLPTGAADDFAYGNEDTLCADYVQSLLEERENTLAKDIAHLRSTDRFAHWETGEVDFPFEDIAAVLDVDRFHFAMIGTHKEWQGISYVNVQRVDVEKG